MLNLVSIIQGLIFIVTGLWPLVSARTFERVTGPKVDFWLVKVVGMLLAVVGSVLVLAGRRRRVTPEVALVGIGSSATLAGADLVYATRGRISRVYLLDFVLEMGLIGLWVFALVKAQRIFH